MNEILLIFYEVIIGLVYVDYNIVVFLCFVFGNFIMLCGKEYMN